HRIGMIGAQNRVGVMRAVAVDVGDGLVKVLDHLDADDGREILGAPILLGGAAELGVRYLRKNALGGRVAAPLHALGGEDGTYLRQELGGRGGMHQQRFGGVAGAVFLRLGVVGDDQRLLDIDFGIDIGVAVAVEMLDHRHLGFGADALDQTLAAARDDDVHRLGHGDQAADAGAVGGFHELYRRRRQAGFGECLLYQLPQRQIRVNGFRTAAQDAGVAALDGERGGLDGDVGATLVDHAEHAQRHAHLADADARRAALDAGDLADGVGHGGQLFAAFGHGGQHLG